MQVPVSEPRKPASDVAAEFAAMVSVHSTLAILHFPHIPTLYSDVCSKLWPLDLPYPISRFGGLRR